MPSTQIFFEAADAVQRLSLEQKVVLLHQIALAVHAAHSQGMLHREQFAQSRKSV